MTVDDGAPPATAEPAASAVAVIRRIPIAVKRFWFDREGSAVAERVVARAVAIAQSGESHTVTGLSIVSFQRAARATGPTGSSSHRSARAAAHLDCQDSRAALSADVIVVGSPSRGDVMVAALREAVQSREPRGEVIDERQLTLGVTDRQQPPHRMAAYDHPVHIVAGAVHADVIQRRESMASEEVDGS